MAAIAPNTQDQSKLRVAYYYDRNIGNDFLGQGDDMKPNRIIMTHHLLLNYGIYRELEVYRPFPATYEELTSFHSTDYVDFIKNTTVDTVSQKTACQFNMGEDYPIGGLYEYCKLSSGGSRSAAVKLNKKKADIAINWMGGLHHAKQTEAYGFCYTNDIVLGIMELLNHHKRVLYVDIDVHHGDGVEEAFYTTDRVMTVSFHRYDGGFFPGTGNVTDVGAHEGQYYALNVPLRAGITDITYESIFTPVMERVMERFKPDAVVLQCGGDSLVGDRLGPFNLTLKGHGKCVEFFRGYNLPLMLVGGGGYTQHNVARCWAYETALAINKEIPNELPYNDYFEYYGPNYLLHIQPSSSNNENSREYLKKIKEAVFHNIDQLNFAPSVQMQPIPDDALKFVNDNSLLKDAANPDSRLHPAIMDDVVQDQGEFYDGETEGDDRRNEHNAKGAACEEKIRENKDEL